MLEFVPWWISIVMKEMCSKLLRLTIFLQVFLSVGLVLLFQPLTPIVVFTRWYGLLGFGFFLISLLLLLLFLHLSLFLLRQVIKAFLIQLQFPFGKIRLE